MFRFLPIVAVLFLAGCQAKLSVVKNYNLPDDNQDTIKIIEMPSQAGAQTLNITVTVKSGDAIDVFVMKADDIGSVFAQENEEKKKWEKNALGFKRELKSDSFKVNVPANTKYKVVCIQADGAKQKSQFELKVVN